MTTNSSDNTPVQDAPATGPSDDELFDAAVAEIEADESGAPADNAAASDEADDTQGADAKAPPADDGLADDAADSKAPADTPPAGTTPTDDIWSTVDPAVREAHEKALRDSELRYRSAASRQSAADRKIAELSQQLEALKRGPAGAGDDRKQGNDDQPKDGGKSRDEIFAELREEYPDLATPIVEEMADLRAEIKKLSEGVNDYQQRRTAADLDEQEGILAKQHPDWLEAAQDERFRGWLETQPTAIREAFARNERAIVDGREAALVVRLFKTDVGFAAKPQDQQRQGRDERRERQLKGNRDATNAGGPAAKTGFDRDDFDSVVAALSEKM